ncbi:hypothetical protein OBV_39300 [Oscillibacter valericigenes Sjm18-20]|nr:hypothetical protein OBV_39300 [Oscillibacter valericigenes Sjm18-20]
MQVSYDRLWKVLIDKKMNRTKLKTEAGISFNVLAKLGRNELVSMESLQKICKTLKCDIGDVVTFNVEEK